ncbi:MAG: prepilin-type N-terminal cleavage/methylation domain-containing protein [candidate division SR1 bacterium]|nr:prepilin-type N-terminal cleavage/methylation domain-containing protein [candidate division SR1 bacterium]
MRKKFGFTLIEVIVAITVFAIGVLAVLRLITQNLVTLDITQMRTNATFLAKEGIELVYNMRDSNNSKGLPWDCVLVPNLLTGDWGTLENPEAACLWRFSSGSEDHKVLQISFNPDGYTYTLPHVAETTFNELWSGNVLYYVTGTVGGHEIFWYSSLPVQETTPTFFSRYIVFTGVIEGQNILPRENILKIESHVLYNKGGKTGEVVLESFIGNY